MYLDAKAEHRAYQIRREKLEQYLKAGWAKSIIVSETPLPEQPGLDPAETDMLYTLLSKIRD